MWVSQATSNPYPNSSPPAIQYIWKRAKLGDGRLTGTYGFLLRGRSATTVSLTLTGPRGRERYPQVGMLLQTDGNRHDWLERRGPWLPLMGMIDDANSEMLVRFSGKKKMPSSISWCCSKSA